MNAITSSVDACVQSILQGDLNLDHYFICQKSDGTIYLREKPFFEKYFGIVGKCFSNRTDADFSKLVVSASALLNRLRNNPQFNSHAQQATIAEKIYKVVEKVVKAGHFESPDTRSRDFLKMTDNHYNTITGKVGELSQRYPQIPDSELPVDAWLPFQHTGLSGFVNTALRILAHSAVYRNIVDPELNPLKKGPKESEASFEARQRAQVALHGVIKDILNGTPFCLATIIPTINQALKEMRQPHQHSLKHGGESFLLLYDIMTLCGAPFVTDRIHYVNTEILSTPGELEDSLKSWQKNDSNKLPEMVMLLNFEEKETTPPSEITMGGAVYRLEAIEKGDNEHTVPWVRTEKGDFVALDDQPSPMGQEWIQAHYILLNNKVQEGPANGPPHYTPIDLNAPITPNSDHHYTPPIL